MTQAGPGVGGPGHDFGRMASELADRVKAMLQPLEDVCRYREQRNEDYASYEVTPRNKQALAFSIAVAAGGANVETAHFKIREFPVADADVVIQMVEAFLLGRVRRVTRLSAGGKLLAGKTYVFGRDGGILFKHRKQMGVLAGFMRTARRERVRFGAYRATTPRPPP
jgi:hypothetical protein